MTLLANLYLDLIQIRINFGLNKSYLAVQSLAHLVPRVADNRRPSTVGSAERA